MYSDNASSVTTDRPSTYVNYIKLWRHQGGSHACLAQVKLRMQFQNLLQLAVNLSAMLAAYEGLGDYDPRIYGLFVFILLYY